MRLLGLAFGAFVAKARLDTPSLHSVAEQNTNIRNDLHRTMWNLNNAGDEIKGVIKQLQFRLDHMRDVIPTATTTVTTTTATTTATTTTTTTATTTTATATTVATTMTTASCSCTQLGVLVEPQPDPCPPDGTKATGAPCLCDFECDAASGALCVDADGTSICLSTCAQNEDCTGGRICDEESGTCVLPLGSTGCSSRLDCPNGAVCEPDSEKCLGARGQLCGNEPEGTGNTGDATKCLSGSCTSVAIGQFECDAPAGLSLNEVCDLEDYDYLDDDPCAGDLVCANSGYTESPPNPNGVLRCRRRYLDSCSEPSECASGQCGPASPNTSSTQCLLTPYLRRLVRERNLQVVCSHDETCFGPITCGVPAGALCAFFAAGEACITPGSQYECDMPDTVGLDEFQVCMEDPSIPGSYVCPAIN